MPVIGGLGLHILLALFCAVHAVRSGQQLYWLIILFMFPLLGSLVYFFVIYLPNSRLDRGARKAVSAAAKALDPTKELRAARADYDEVPTAQNQMRLAAALLEAGQPEEAGRLYEGGLKGPFASDPELRYGAARAFVESQRYADALVHLEELRRSRPDYRPDAIALLLARSYAGSSRGAEAREEFERTVQRFGTFEAHAEYAIWALATGDTATAARLQTEMDKMIARWNALSRQLNDPVLRRLKAAQQLARS
ncbi:tetratricopeptide repeat protein [Pelomonas sp. KK5]|uniref:tetratricopeptide repeat protein n=1 Tax=Pelomonas sp. KK5 TaxID=1855730 RepID=UPI00097C6D97|nr:tetratricopeptide repeat protein [Pelomonas sp. KK5]